MIENSQSVLTAGKPVTGATDAQQGHKSMPGKCNTNAPGIVDMFVGGTLEATKVSGLGSATETSGYKAQSDFADPTELPISTLAS